MVGLVIVSHSAKVAEGIAEMAAQMARKDQMIIAAGGMADGGIGTDAMRVHEAVCRADGGRPACVVAEPGGGGL